ncbi:MAG: hypothetical protein K2W85_07875 [Phycisphaerales bacterium]|nr:hypothetical protein [Phycisphaerales bacterium]
MFNGVITLLAQTRRDDDLTAVLFLVAAVVGVAAFVMLCMLLDERKKRRILEQRLGGLMAETDERRLHDERNSLMFEQQKQLNDLMAAKFQAELRLLEAQLATMKNHPDREEAGKEAHELMVEKTRLEIDGLRLHNAEARRRAEDWRGD